ncbi:MAG TPA: 6-carboxytetrahydropterin synthase QueD [Thermodesulfobacteriota bacterium]|nr:6-carboxytetrahydropterin synthase QueD [Thermodesulfobacteriota bacterium]
MYELMVHTHFSSAHSLRGYRGKCEELHGHNWKVGVQVKAEMLDDIGMVIDFKVLKHELHKIVQKLDHTYLNDIPPFDALNPSSENIAFYIFQELKKSLTHEKVMAAKVTVWESDDSSASYSEK